MTLPHGAILYNFLIVICTWAGAGLSIWTNGNRRMVRPTISFSAGIFLGVAFLHMLPESSHLLGEQAGMFVLAGFLLVWLLERFFMLHACEEDHCDFHHVGAAAFWGLAIHSLMNGLAMGSSLLIPGIGFTVFLATVAHKAPESFSLVSLLSLGRRNTSVVIGYVIALSLMVPVGSAIALIGLNRFDGRITGIVVAMSAGTFLKIATGDLLPETHAKGDQRWSALAGFILGLGLTIVTKMIEGHA